MIDRTFIYPALSLCQLSIPMSSLHLPSSSLLLSAFRLPPERVHKTKQTGLIKSLLNRTLKVPYFLLMWN